ncbi:MAG: 4-(cytidine 5'-diphospho)-2-C-methyl-D-erythritol kinase [Bifidobacteriaceae bacterium]|jgi:4-diphosphocytidyl-2-C-methyl-D-erythritol kinase|nr:4-(cytidine 5'-diphospho)-2-C-methyl-D-erythritol kinase [Bifidobacteriaceae bacterium]
MAEANAGGGAELRSGFGARAPERVPPASVIARAPAKINLALRVGARRADGFHPLNTLFHAVDLWEQVTVLSLWQPRGANNGDHSEPAPAGGPYDRAVVAGRGAAAVPTGAVPAGLGDGAGGGGLEPGSPRGWRGQASGDQVTVTGRGAAAVPTGWDNLALRAAALLRRVGGPLPRLVLAPVRLEIAKAIPVAGGLAGGSADAAAALLALNQLWGLGLGQDCLVGLAAELGSDVPFAVRGGNCAGQGRGERLETLASGGPLHWVLATSRSGLSTPAVFREFDALTPGRAPEPPPVPAALVEGLRRGDPEMVGDHLVNDLEPAAFALRPELEGLVRAALEAGACGAVVSGSGPTVACLAAGQAGAAALAGRLAKVHTAGEILLASGPATTPPPRPR